MKNRCEICEYHSAWTEQGIEVGFVCKHPEQTEKPGLMYGRFFSHIVTSPKWCPFDKEIEKKFDVERAVLDESAGSDN